MTRNSTGGHGVPVRPFAEVGWHVARRFQPFQHNTHHALLGDSGSGKSHTIRYGILAALGPAVTGVIVDLKPGGDRVWRGFGEHVGPGELPCPLRPGLWHLSAPGGLTRAEVRPALEQLAAERSAVVVLDDATTVTDSEGERGGMGLGGLVDRMLREGRTNGLSAILGLNSPKWAGRGGAKTLCGVYWIGSASSESLEGFADIAGLPSAARGALDPEHLPEHRWLYCAKDRDAPGGLALALTDPPAAAA